MKWLKLLIRFFKKIKNNMISEEQLISYKQNFTGEMFQWIKTTNPSLMGKVVKCRDIQPIGNSIFAIFDDGSQIPVYRINNDLMMIHGDMQPLTKDEVIAINGPAIQPKENNTIPKQENIHSIKTTEPSLTSNKSKILSEEVKKNENPFKIFSSDETDFLFKLRIKIPDKKLLKMMYNSAEDKKMFISQLSEYVYEYLTLNIIEESIEELLDPKPKTRKYNKNEESIKLIQVDNE